MARPRAPQEVGDGCLTMEPELLFFFFWRRWLGLAAHQGVRLCLIYQNADFCFNGRRGVQVGLVFMLDGKEICAFLRVKCPI